LQPEPVVARADVIAGAAELGVAVSPAAADRLVRFAGLLARWNTVHNLTSIDSPAGMLSHHLLDSVSIVPALDAIFGERPARVLDVGAGGGLPGIPLAIVRPAYAVTLIDKVQKKAAFMTQARVELGLTNVECVHGRVEDLTTGRFDLVVSRAFATLDMFVGLTRHVVAPGGWWAAMKGTLPTAEIEALRRSFPEVRVVDAVKLDVPRLGAERHLILLQSV
jgi:16S rRNA (guanine527-N7)-methyltransferase